MWDSEYLDYILVSFGFFIVFVYHVSFWMNIKSSPNLTIVGMNRESRREWVDFILRDKRNILAVHTLRNQILAASTLATTSIILVSTVGGITFSTGDKLPTLNEIVIGSKSQLLSNIKLMAVLVCFLFSFFCYTSSLRYASDVCYLFGIPIRESEGLVDANVLHTVLQRSHNFFTMGHRGFYISFLFIFWLFGPIPMVIASVGLVVVLQYLDGPAANFQESESEAPAPEQNGNCVLPASS